MAIKVDSISNILLKELFPKIVIIMQKCVATEYFVEVCCIRSIMKVMPEGL